LDTIDRLIDVDEGEEDKINEVLEQTKVRVAEVKREPFDFDSEF